VQFSYEFESLVKLAYFVLNNTIANLVDTSLSSICQRLKLTSSNGCADWFVHHM